MSSLLVTNAFRTTLSHVVCLLSLFRVCLFVVVGVVVSRRTGGWSGGGPVSLQRARCDPLSPDHARAGHNWQGRLSHTTRERHDCSTQQEGYNLAFIPPRRSSSCTGCGRSRLALAADLSVAAAQSQSPQTHDRQTDEVSAVRHEQREGRERRRTDVRAEECMDDSRDSL